MPDSSFGSILKAALLSAVAIAAGRFVYKAFADDSFKLGVSKEADRKTLYKLARKLNGTLPQPVDEITTFERVDVTNDGLVLNYKVNLSKETIENSGAVEQMEPKFRASACSNRAFRTLIDGGYSLTVYYASISDRPAGELTIAANSCK